MGLTASVRDASITRLLSTCLPAAQWHRVGFGVTLRGWSGCPVVVMCACSSAFTGTTECIQTCISAACARMYVCVCAGQVVYRIGASGDVRTLWRLMATHDASDIAAATGSVMVDSNDTAAGETKASGSSSSNNGGSRALQVGGEGILPKLGGTTGLRHLPTFPLTHQELRTQMAKAGLPTSKLTSDALQAGTTDLSAAERRKARRAYRVRKPHKASLMMDLGYLKGTAAGGAAQRAMLELALEKYAKEKSAAEGRHLEDIHKSSGAAFVVGGGGRS